MPRPLIQYGGECYIVFEFRVRISTFPCVGEKMGHAKKKAGSLASEFQFLRDCLQFIHQTRMDCVTLPEQIRDWQSVQVRMRDGTQISRSARK